MASLDSYPLKSGATQHRVRWYEGGTQHRELFTSREAAVKWKAVIEVAGDRGRALAALEQAAETGPTVAATMRAHIDQLTRVGPYQLKRYRGAVAQHFSGDLGAMPVAAVAHADVVAWVRWMQGKGLSAKTIANHHGLLSASMGTAVALGHRSDNPCSRVALPRDESVADTMRIIEPDVFEDLVEAMREHYRPFTRFLLYTGVRFSEATALVAADFRLDAKVPTVRVTKAWKEDESHGFYVGPPKTRKARRTVALGASCVAAVGPLVAAAGDGLVFRSVWGRPLRGTRYHDAWRKAWVMLGQGAEDRPRPHDLRHTHASMMLSAGMSLFELSRRMGHESTNTTARVYSHLMDDAHARGAGIADQAFG